MSDTTILTAVNERKSRRDFSNLWVIATSEEPTDEAEQIFEERKREYPEASNLSFYELDEEVPLQAVFIDFTFSPLGKTRSKIWWNVEGDGDSAKEHE